MIKISFDPNITQEDIDVALSYEGANDFEFSDETLFELEETKKSYRKKIISDTILYIIAGGGLFGLSFLFGDHWLGKIAFMGGPIMIIMMTVIGIWRYAKSFTDASQTNPKKIMKSFLENEGDYGRSFKLVLPSVISEIAVEDFAESWQRIYQEDIINIIKFQENTSCDVCSEETSGLWTVLNYQLPDEYFETNGYYLRCVNCETVFCPSCYLEIGKTGSFKETRKCPTCEKTLDQFHPIFLPDPKLNGGQVVFNVSVEYEMDGKIAQLQAKSNTVYTLEKIVEPTNELWDSPYSDLGDRGVVEVTFKNTGVLVGDKWYLMAAFPKGHDSSRTEFTMDGTILELGEAKYSSQETEIKEVQLRSNHQSISAPVDVPMEISDANDIPKEDPSTCPKCHCKIETYEFTCPNCGHTQWELIGCGGVLSLIAVGFVVYRIINGNTTGILFWGGVLLAVVLVAVVIQSVIQSIRLKR